MTSARIGSRAGTVISSEKFDQLVRLTAQPGFPPASFLAFRRNQLELMLEQAAVDIDSKVILEVGGGVSGQSFLLSERAGSVICTDLLEVRSVHGGDFTKARVLQDAGEDRLRFVCARGENIPLKDESVDLVFSSFVLEHVDDRPATLREMYRALRPGGVAILNVPNTMEPVFRGLWHYVRTVPTQVIKAVVAWTGLGRALRLPFRSPPPGRPDSPGEAFQWFRNLLDYETHGTYPSRRQEVRESRPRIWDRLYTGAGFTIERRFTVSLEDYVAFSFYPLFIWFQRLLLGVVSHIGSSRPAVIAGTSYCTVLRKASASGR